MTTALGYVRVSTEEQARSGLSIEAQTQAIHATARQRGWDLVDVITDAGVSGRKANRPGLDEAKRRMRRGDGEVLIVAKLDRLSRSLLAGAKLMKTAEAQHWAVVTTDNAVDMSTASGKFLTNILLSAAEYESAMNSARTKDAMAAAKARGATFGKPTAYPDALLERIRDLNADGLSLRQIAETLTSEGVTTTRGGQWHASSVRSVLRSERMQNLYRHETTR